jgi:hypothetical protein
MLIKIAGGLVLVVLLVAYVVRGRARTHRPRSRSRSDIRPTLPPSPYQPSRGFRILDGSEPETPPAVQLPRIDPQHEFVFNDPLASSIEPTSPPHLRHDEQWALDRSMRHVAPPRLRRRRRWAWAILIAVVLAGIAAVIVAAGHHTATHALALVGATPLRHL